MIRLNSVDPGRSLTGPGYSAESQWMQPAESFRNDLPSGGPEVRSHHSFARIWLSERAFTVLIIPAVTCDRIMIGWLFRQGARTWLLEQNRVTAVPKVGTCVELVCGCHIIAGELSWLHRSHKAYTAWKILAVATW